MATKQDHAPLMMQFPKAIALVAVTMVLSSCKTDDVRDDAPARIVDPTPESRAELQRAISDAPNVGEVILADDALVNDSVLIIEPAHLTGRDLRRPAHFRLVLSRSHCVLVHEGTEARFELTDTSCAAE